MVSEFPPAAGGPEGKVNAVARAVTGEDHPEGTFDSDGDLRHGAQLLAFRLGDANDFRWFRHATS